MLTLHFAPNSRASRTLWLLEELGLEYELNRMDFHPKDLKSDEHRARHPLGRIPVLDDGDVSIYESGGFTNEICGHLKINESFQTKLEGVGLGIHVGMVGEHGALNAPNRRGVAGL